MLKVRRHCNASGMFADGSVDDHYATQSENTASVLDHVGDISYKGRRQRYPENDSWLIRLGHSQKIELHVLVVVVS